MLFADLEVAAAATRQEVGAGVDDAPARADGGKVALRRLTAREALHVDARRRPSIDGGELLELQFQ